MTWWLITRKEKFTLKFTSVSEVNHADRRIQFHSSALIGLAWPGCVTRISKHTILLAGKNVSVDVSNVCVLVGSFLDVRPFC
jgi:hypothetical protein